MLLADTHQQDGEGGEVAAAAGGGLGRGVEQEAAGRAPAASSASREGTRR